MGRQVSYAIDIRNRHPLCSALSYEEWNRLVEKIGTDDAVSLGFRTRERDRMLEDGAKSVPKHRISKRGIGWP